MTPIIRQSLHDQVLEHLRKRIVEGYWAGGTVIPELEVCEQLEVSRTPVRESLKVLAAEGLVEMLPRSGARVKILGVDEVRQLFETIAILEAAAGRLACAHASDAEIRAIEALHNKLVNRHEKDDRAGYFDANKSIHLAIARASGNEVLTSMHQQLMTRMQRVRFACSRRDEEWATSIHEHDDIMAALRERNGDRLADLVVTHMEHGWQRVRPYVEAETSQLNIGARKPAARTGSRARVFV